MLTQTTAVSRKGLIGAVGSRLSPGPPRELRDGRSPVGHGVFVGSPQASGWLRPGVLFVVLLFSSGSNSAAERDEEMPQRLLTTPQVHKAAAKEANRQVASGEFFDETAMKAVLAAVLGVDPTALPPIQLGPFPGETGNTSARKELATVSDWQRALQEEALQPAVQHALQKALLDHLQSGGRLATGPSVDGAVLRGALSELPPSGVRRILERSPAPSQEHRTVELPPVSETMALLNTEDRRLLADHRDVLADHGRLIREMPSWPSDLRAAARRFIALSRGEATEPDDHAEAEANSAAYRDRTGSPSSLERHLDAIERRSLASALGADTRGVAARTPMFDSAEFPEHRFEDFVHRSVGVFRMKQVPAYGTVPDTKVYVVPTTHGAIRIFTDTAFGSPMIVEETRVDDERAAPVDAPGDYVIAGRAASVSLVKYREDWWETSVYAYDGRTSVHVEIAARLEGAALDSFVDFVRHLVESDR